MAYIVMALQVQDIIQFLLHVVSSIKDQDTHLHGSVRHEDIVMALYSYGHT